jgi:hypothetical protein
MTYVIAGWLLFCLGFVLGALWASRKLEKIAVTYMAFGEEVMSVEKIRHVRQKAQSN